MCPECGCDAKFVGYRPCKITTLLGSAIYERAYYHCAACHHGQFPTDADFRIADHQTLGASEVISLMGLLEPFDEGAHKTLPRVTGLNVSASTVQRTTEAAGTDVAERRESGETFAEDEVWDWRQDVTGRKVAYVELDATGVRQQGPHAERAEGRMPWAAWSSIRCPWIRSVATVADVSMRNLAVCRD